jgi:phage host-nuclease inhibitor protein Gam
MAKKTQEKTIIAAVINSRTEMDTAVGRIGELQSQKQAVEADYNARILALQNELASSIEPMDLEIQSLSKGVKAFCDAHRAEILPVDKKSAELVTGKIAYRDKVPKVSTRSTEKLIERLIDEAGLTEYRERVEKKFARILLRMKLDLDKEACLNSPSKAEELGIEIEDGIERFYIKPTVTSTEVEVAA